MDLSEPTRSTPLTQNAPDAVLPPARLVVLGAGGIGRTMLRLLAHKRTFALHGVCDRSGLLFDAVTPLASGTLADALDASGSIGALEGARVADDPLDQMLRLIADPSHRIDGVFLALPNLPNAFFPSLLDRLLELGYRGAAVDALKRSGAVELMFARHDRAAAAGLTYVTGCGATPGLLTAAAALLAQSFVEVEEVDIQFGVGLGSWESYRATVREDLAHVLPFTPESVAQMSDTQVEAEVMGARGGILQLRGMEHADDVMLERVGVVDRTKVHVGGVVDCTSSVKPLTTTLRVTGRTFDGEVATHTLQLGDRTSMAANVNGTALGYLRTAIELNRQGIGGVLSSAHHLPRFSD